MTVLRRAAALGDKAPEAQEAVDDGVVEPDEPDEPVDEDAAEPEELDESEDPAELDEALDEALADGVLFDGLVALLDERESVL